MRADVEAASTDEIPPWLLGLLRCPLCGGTLSPEALDGGLRCSHCEAVHPVRGGVPRLLPADLSADVDAVSAHFTSEFTAAEQDDADLGDEEHSAWILWSRTGLDPRVLAWRPPDWYPAELPDEAPRGDAAVLAGKTVLDAGCGPARLARVAARGADRVVALDLGDHVQRARRVLAAYDSAAVVQGSVLAPPLAPQTFDVVYSVGVLHHTPDPAGGVRALAALLRPGGRLSVWVYPPEYWGGRVRGPFNRAVHRWMRSLSARSARRLAERVLYPLGRLQEALARRPLTKLLAAPLFLVSVPRHPDRAVMLTTILDYFGPRIVSTHTAEEVEGWFRDAGLVQVERLPVGSSATGLAPAA